MSDTPTPTPAESTPSLPTPTPTPSSETPLPPETSPQNTAEVPVSPMLSAVEPTTAATSTADRRRFLLLGSWLSVGWASLAATAGVWGVSFLRYLFPNIVIEPSPNRVKVGFVESFPDGQVAEQFKEQNIWIVRKDGFLFALSTTCTHLGCTINWQENAQKFKCPCHGSGYTIAGINVEGPSQRPLERWGIALADDGEIVVDKGRVFQHERGDWNNPESFLRV